MKILLSEEQLRKLIKEDLGVSRAGIAYTNLMLDKLTPIVTFFTSLNRGFNKEVVIDLNEINKVYQSSVDDFIDLPIEKIYIKLSCKKFKKESSNVPFVTGGAAYPIEKKYKKNSYLTEPSLMLPKYILEEVTQTIVAKFDIEVTTTINFTKDMLDELLYDLRDTILHELNHMVEYYNRTQTGAPSMNVSLSWSGQKNYNLPKNIFDFWNTFLDLVYYSEPYEINAMSQEAYSQVLRKSFEEMKEGRLWKISNTMKDFNYGNYISELNQKIDTWKPNSVDSVHDSLYRWFIEDYSENMKTSKQDIPRFIGKSNDLTTLIKKFQPVINKAGEKLQKNIMRLYSLK